jgi:hypothetical protein
MLTKVALEERSHSIYLGMYTRGTLLAEAFYSILAELESVGIPFTLGTPIIGQCIEDANNEMAEDFLASGCGYLLHLDDDQVLPNDALRLMLEAHADVVTLHACNRGKKYRSGIKRFWERPDNHRREEGKISYFSQAVMLATRRVFELLPKPWWLAQNDKTGEIYFCESVLTHASLTQVTLPIVSPHLEVITFNGASDEFRFMCRRHGRDYGHQIIKYECVSDFKSV